MQVWQTWPEFVCLKSKKWSFSQIIYLFLNIFHWSSRKLDWQPLQFGLQKFQENVAESARTITKFLNFPVSEIFLETFIWKLRRQFWQLCRKFFVQSPTTWKSNVSIKKKCFFKILHWKTGLLDCTFDNLPRACCQWSQEK